MATAGAEMFAENEDTITVSQEPRPGDFVTPNLRLVSPLGKGGMGHVWVAEHLGLRTNVVVKFMAGHLTGDPVMVERFGREAAAASRVKSPHVVQMIDHGVATNGHLFIAMELLEGHDLGEVLVHKRRLPAQRVLTIVQQVGRALSKAHEAGIVHRDIKPENIFLLDAGGGELFVKVLDFGVAKSMLSLPDRGTATGAMVGTPYYMSPEQVLGSRAIDYGTDLWALGVVTFEALTGTLPFNGDTIGGISVAICHEPLPSMAQRNPELPAMLDSWFARACARKHEERFRSAMELVEGLKAALAAPGADLSARVEVDGSAVRLPIADAPQTENRERRHTTGGTVSATVPATPTRPRWVVPAAIGGMLALTCAGVAVGITVAKPEGAVEEPTPVKKKKKSVAASVEDPALATGTENAVPSTSAPPSTTPPMAATTATASSPSTAPEKKAEPALTSSVAPEKKAEPAPTPSATKKKKRDVVIE